jgi:hypothetical protein
VGRKQTETIQRVLGGSDRRWWLVEGPVHQALFPFIDGMRVRERDSFYRACLELYMGGPVDGFGRLADTGPKRKGRRKLAGKKSTNVVARTISSVMSEAAQGAPRPQISTVGGDFFARFEAEKLTQWLDGLFTQEQVDAEADNASEDSCVYGTGIVKCVDPTTSAARGRIRFERVHPWNFFVDEREEQHPRSAYEQRWIDRAQLIDAFPKSRKAIVNAPSEGWDEALGKDLGADQIRVIEAWHVPARARSGDEPGSGDGRHVICIAGATLLDEPWEDEDIPFVWWHWEPPNIGFTGIGIAERLAGMQEDIDDLTEGVRKALRFGCVRVFVETQSEVTETDLESEDGTVVHYTGQPPIISNVNPINPGMAAERERLESLAFAEVGVSEVAAQAEKPAGLSSGKALLVFADHRSKRLQRWLKARDAAYVRMGELAIAQARRLSKKDKSYEVVYTSGEYSERIDFASINLEEGSYVTRVFPVSALSTTPAARIQDVTNLINGGVLDALGADEQMVAKLLNIPDLKAAGFTNELDDIQRDVDKMLRDGVYMPPEPFMKPMLCVAVARAAYHGARLHDAPEERLQLLRDYVAAAVQLGKAAAPPPAPAAPMPGPGGPVPIPGPPPALPPAAAA